MVSLRAQPGATGCNGQHEGAENLQSSVEPEEDTDTFAHLHNSEGQPVHKTEPYDSDLVPLRRLQTGLFDVSSRHQVLLVPKFGFWETVPARCCNSGPLTLSVQTVGRTRERLEQMSHAESCDFALKVSACATLV